MKMTTIDTQFAGRRRLLSLGTAAGAATLLNALPSAGAEPRVEQNSVHSNVKSFGAVGDGRSDDTASLQMALDAAFKDGGGTVYVPPGKYLLKETLNIPDGVTLRGSYSCVPSHAGLRNQGEPKPGQDGTALFVTAGRGHEDGTPFATVNTNSTICGLTIYYPEQVTSAAPIPYPWTIAMRGMNPAVFDIELLNPYQGIDASQNARHNIRNITGQPLRRGVFVDEVYDIGRIENVHFNPWWSFKSPVSKWQMENGEAFIFGRSDWEYVLNTFCYAYLTGYKFIPTLKGSCNGNFLGIGADNCNRAILVEQCDKYGLLITNAEFTSFSGEQPTMVEVRAENKGVVRISNSAFWGPCDQIARIAGQGTVGFSDCTFVQWGEDNDRAAIEASSGSLLIHGCEFLQNKKHVLLGGDVSCAVVASNLFRGKPQILNSSQGDVQIGLNAAHQ